MYYDSTYILLIIGAILTLAASAKVKSTFNKFNKVRSFRGMSGAAAAAKILKENGLENVPVYEVPGNLTYHYDPRNRTLNLSQTVYGSTSIVE